MAIIISKNGKNAKKIDKSDFEKEDFLQQYISQNPESIPLYDIKEDIRLLILAREFSTDSGPIDAIGVDKDGEIYLIETKLYKNPDKRLVVAQVLDYGASLWHSALDFNEFTRLLEDETSKKFSISLHQKLYDFFEIEEDEVSVLLENMKKNLNEGSFKFVVLMDKLRDQLKDLIIFLNENSRFDIFAVELEYYKHEDYEIMIPRLFGAEVKKDIAVSSAGTRRKWDEQSFFEDVASKLSKKELEAIRKLYEFSKNRASNISWGTGITRASFSPKFDKISARSLFTVRSTGKLSLNFGWLSDDEGAVRFRERFKELLEKKELFQIPENYKDHFPEYRIEEWRGKADEFMQVVKNLLIE